MSDPTPTPANTFSVQGTTAQLSFLSPNFGVRGKTLTLTIGGSDLTGATAVTATPGTGITFLGAPIVNAEGTELTVDMQIAADAPADGPEGTHVIQVSTPQGVSDPTPTQANTFFVFSDID